MPQADVDIRVLGDFPTHPKTEELGRLLGWRAVVCLVQLWLFARKNRPKGVLTNMKALRIAIAAKWPGDADEFVNALVDIGWLDLHDEKGTYELHDWKENQPYAYYAEERQARARRAAAARWDGRATDRTDAGYANRNAGGNANGNAPSPAPVPDPVPNPNKLPRGLAQSVLDDLNQVGGRNFESKGDRGATNRAKVTALLKKGFTEDDIKLVHRFKARDWRGQKTQDGKPRMNWFQPSTLYSATKFPEYLTAAQDAGPITEGSGNGFGESGQKDI